MRQRKVNNNFSTPLVKTVISYSLSKYLILWKNVTESSEAELTVWDKKPQVKGKGLMRAV